LAGLSIISIAYKEMGYVKSISINSHPKSSNGRKMIIKFKNWEKHQTRKDITHTRWFKLSNDIFSDPKISEFNPEEFKTFIYLLCEASKANKNGEVFISETHFQSHVHVAHHVAHHVLYQTIKKLQQLQIIEKPTTRGRYAKVPESALDKIRLEEIREEEKNKIQPSAGEPVRANPVGIWINAYQAKYGVRYQLQAKDGKILQNFQRDRSEDEIRILFACYLAIDEKFYSDQKHPLSLFFRDLQKISVAAKTGINPDDFAKNILDKVFAKNKQPLLGEEK
jgi:6-pyruvoyl-tetrahydropterin synthase